MDGGMLEGTGTLNGRGSFAITELTVDMITVPTGLFYEEKNWIEYIGQNTKPATKTYCNKEFQVTGWTQSVTKAPSSDLIYTVTYTPDSSIGGTAITKTVTLAQSGTTLTATLDNGTEMQSYAYSDTINITATVKASGAAPAMLAANFDEPTGGQVAVYEGDTQVCAPTTPENGACTFTIPAKELGAGEHTLTVKYIESTVMAEATLDVTVTVAACPHTTLDGDSKCTVCEQLVVAEVTIGGVTTRYTDFAEAWKSARYKTATITLLASTTTSRSLPADKSYTDEKTNITLKAQGDATLASNYQLDSLFSIEEGGTVTIENSNYSVPKNGSCCISVTGGTVNIKGGMFTGGSSPAFYVDHGTVQLSGGTFTNSSQEPIAIEIVDYCDLTLNDLLADGYAYKMDSGWVSGGDLEGKQAPRAPR